MNSAIAILEKLITDPSVTSKEHVLETASRHSSDAQGRFEQSFERVVSEISAIWGNPEFNSQIRKEAEGTDPQQSSGGELKRVLGTVVPPWCQGSPRHGGKPKALRLAHWKKPEGVLYIVLRTELDGEKEIPLYYDLVLGARRRKPEVDRSTAQLRQSKESWFKHLIAFFDWFRGR